MKKLVAALSASLTIASASALIADTPQAYAAERKPGAEKSEPITVKDLVCGMDVETKDAKFVYEYKGKKYYFCMKSDMESFKKDPEKYIKKGGK